jgi:hypothetical protein
MGPRAQCIMEPDSAGNVSRNWGSTKVDSQVLFEKICGYTR